MGSKDIENKILNYDLDINELDEYLELDENFNNGITGMINALYVLLKKPKNNTQIIEEIFLELDSLIKDQEDDLKLNLIIGLIDNLNKRIESSYNNKSKNDIIGFRNKLFQIIQKIKIRQERLIENNIMCILQKLIYEERDLDKIKVVIRSKKHIDYCNFEKIFCNILEQYVYLENEDDINYYYKLIVLFIESTFNKLILRDADKYLKILNKGNKKEHIKLIENRFKDKSIDLKELEQKYDIKFNNTLIYSGGNIDLCSFLRHDFTYQKVITIDDEGNKCNDDGFYIERNCDGSYTLYIHISDVPSLVKKDSLIDLYAYKAAETIYLKDVEIPLYPEIISNNLGSLISGTRTNVISYIFKLTPSLEVDPNSFTIKRGIVDVYRSLSYEEVDKRIKRKSIDELDDMLKTLEVVASLLKANNLHKDIYRSAENKTTGKITNSARSNKSASAKIVQEMMVLTNKHIDMYFSHRGYPYIHRVHDEPSPEIDKDLMLILGLDQEILANNPKCVKILNAVKEKYLNARYSNISSGHYGLGLDHYSHSTSPLRRYADGLGQYIMYDILFNCNFDDKTIYHWEEVVKEVCVYLNDRIKSNELFASEYNYLLGKRKIRKR